MEPLNLSNKVSLITGGNKGIGKSIALRLAEKGSCVCITGRDKESLQNTVKELQKLNKNCMGISCDVRNFDEQTHVFEEIKKKYNRLDICVPNAGGAILACATETSLKDWQRDIDTNLTGVFITATKSLNIMKKQKSGNIIGIVSKAGITGFYLRASYCASKWGARGFLKSLAIEAKNYNVKVTSICPASVATDFQKNNPAGMDWMISSDTIADTIEYLISLEENAYVDELLISTWKKPAR